MNITPPALSRSTIPELNDTRALQMYKNYATLSSPMEVPSGQLEYAKALCKHYGLPADQIRESKEADSPLPLVPLYKNRVIIPFSGGIDSTAALVWAKRQGMEVYPLHVYMLNPAAGAREMTAAEKITEALGLRDKLIVVKHPMKLRKMHEYRDRVKHLQENPAKNQYIWLIALPYMQKHGCGTILFAADKEPYASHFSDLEKAHNLFKHYAEKVIGPHSLCIPFDTKKQYVAELLNSKHADLSKLVSSCFASQQHFKYWQDINRKKGEKVPDNECGSCQKCRTLKALRVEILSPAVAPKSIQKNDDRMEIETPQPTMRSVSLFGQNPDQAAPHSKIQQLRPPLGYHPLFLPYSPEMMDLSFPKPSPKRDREEQRQEGAPPFKKFKFDYSPIQNNECIEPAKYSKPRPIFSFKMQENQNLVANLSGFQPFPVLEMPEQSAGMSHLSLRPLQREQALFPPAVSSLPVIPSTPAVKSKPSLLFSKSPKTTQQKIDGMLQGFKFPKTKGDDIYALDFDALKAWMKKTLEDAKDVTQAETEAFYERVGQLLSVEISLQKYDLPYLHNGAARLEPVVNAKVAAESFRQLVSLGEYDFTKTYVGMQAGIKMSAFYMNEERIKASAGAGQSPVMKWKNEELRCKKITKIFKYCAQGKKPYLCLGLPLIANDFLMNAPGQFRPAALFDVLNYLKKSNVAGDITKILDLCAGWGDRLVGAMAAANRFKVVRYIGTDPNKDLTPRYQKIFDACMQVLNQEIKVPFQFTARIYDKPMEDLSEEELNYEGVQSDLMITSPPFFNYEKYKDHGNTQSCVRYPEVDEWLDKFLYKLVDQAKKGVRNHGIVAIHFSTTMYGNRKISELLKAKMGTTLQHITDLAYISKMTRGKQKGYEGEKFFIYQKVDAKEPDAMDIDVR